MYRMTCDGYPLLDTRDEDYILGSPRVKNEVNKVGEGSFKIYYNHPNINKLVPLRSLFEVKDEYGVIFRGRMTEDTKDINNGKDVDLEGVMAFFNDSVVRPYVFPDDFLETPEYIAAASETAEQAALDGGVVRFYLDMLITRHNEQVEPFQQFKLGRVTVYDKNNFIERSASKYPNTWQELSEKTFSSSLGGNLCIRYEEDGNYIDYLREFTEVNAQGITYGENMLDISQNTNASEAYSAIIPLGADTSQATGDVYEGMYGDIVGGSTRPLTLESLPDGNVTDDIVKVGDTLYSKRAVAAYGWRYAPTDETTWSDVKVPENLRNKGVEYLEGESTNIPNTINVTAVDLNCTDDQIRSFRIYKKIPVYTPAHGVNDNFELTALDIDLLNPQNTKITVGKTVFTFTEQQTKQESFLDSILGSYATVQKVAKGFQETETLIEKTSENILLSASKVMSETLEDYSKTSDVKALIEASSDGIIQSLSGTYITQDALKGYATTEEVTNQISQSKNEINLSVQSTIKQEIDDISIGGRNLLLNSDKEVTGTPGYGAEFIQFADLAPIFDKYGLIEYTISFDIKSPDVSQHSTIQLYCQNGSSSKYSIGQTWIPVTTEYVRRYHTFTPTIQNETETASMLAFYGIYGTGNIPCVRNVKIEKGNKATDWTPAPEEYATSTALAEIKVSADKNAANISLLVSDDKADGSLIISAINGESTAKISADRLDIEGKKLNIEVDATNISGTLTIGQLPESVAETSDIPTDTNQLNNSAGYQTESGVTSIIDGTVTADFIKALKLEVGNEISMGANAKISWANVDNQPTIPTNTNQLTNGAGYTTMSDVEDKGYQNASQVTQITKDTISTTNIEAKKISVKDDNNENVFSADASTKRVTIGGWEVSASGISTESTKMLGDDSETFKSLATPDSQSPVRFSAGDTLTRYNEYTGYAIATELPSGTNTISVSCEGELSGVTIKRLYTYPKDDPYNPAKFGTCKYTISNVNGTNNTFQVSFIIFIDLAVYIEYEYTYLKEEEEPTFKVLDDGSLYARSAHISGDIRANTGKVGNMTIEEGALSYGNNFSLNELGLTFNNKDARLQFGNADLYYDEIDNTSCIEANGHLKIFGTNSASIELMKDDSITDSQTLIFTARGTYIKDGEVKLWLESQLSSWGDSTVSVRFRYYNQDCIEVHRDLTFTIQDGAYKSEELRFKIGRNSFGSEFLYVQANNGLYYIVIFRVSGGLEENAVENVGTLFQTKTPKLVSITGHLIPSVNSTDNSIGYNLGHTDAFWNTIYCRNSEIDLSDGNQKNSIQPLSDVHEQIFDALKPVSYKFNVSNNNRTHTGFIAQDVKKAVENAGITTQDFAGYCEWENKDGTVECGLRYSEFIALCVDQIQKLKAKINELEERMTSNGLGT